jgi:hypothetical protein
MAVRLNPKQDERCRSAIQTSQLCRRLNMFALGQPDPQSRRPIEMSDTQVRAALGLLRKTLPDLAVTQIQGDPDRPMVFDIRWADASPTIEGSVEEETREQPTFTLEFAQE